MTIIACVNAYLEEKLLPGCLASLRNQVDRIAVVDGRYASFPGESWKSTDKTVEIARAFGAEVILPPNDEPWPDQPTKRSAYLVGKEGDWYFRIDADERLVGKLPDVATLNIKNVYALRITWPNTLLNSWVPCIFAHRGTMLYDKVHCALFSDGELVTTATNVVRLESPHLIHLKDYRSAERIQAKREYYRWQRENERVYRRQWEI